MTVYTGMKFKELFEMLASTEHHTVGAIHSLIEAASVGADDVNDKGQTMCYIAAKHNHTNVISFLKREMNADVNQPDASGWTPLHAAAAADSVAAIRTLTEECGADPPVVILQRTFLD